VIPGGERFFMYSEAARVNQIMQSQYPYENPEPGPATP
jgi:hypothetical protein